MDDKAWDSGAASDSTLLDRLAGEICSIEHYLDTANALATGCDADANKAARGFCEVAKDEYTHACFIMEWLQHECVAIPEATVQKFKKAEMRLQRAFR